MPTPVPAHRIEHPQRVPWRFERNLLPAKVPAEPAVESAKINHRDPGRMGADHGCRRLAQQAASDLVRDLRDGALVKTQVDSHSISAERIIDRRVAVGGL